MPSPPTPEDTTPPPLPAKEPVRIRAAVLSTPPKPKVTIIATSRATPPTTPQQHKEEKPRKREPEPQPRKSTSTDDEWEVLSTRPARPEAHNGPVVRSPLRSSLPRLCLLSSASRLHIVARRGFDAGACLILLRVHRSSFRPPYVVTSCLSHTLSLSCLSFEGQFALLSFFPSHLPSYYSFAIYDAMNRTRSISLTIFPFPSRSQKKRASTLDGHGISPITPSSSSKILGGLAKLTSPTKVGCNVWPCRCGVLMHGRNDPSRRLRGRASSSTRRPRVPCSFRLL